MNISEDTIVKIAHLARLEISPDEMAGVKEDMEKILSFMDKLNEIDTSGVEPLIYMTSEVNNLREDEVFQEITREEALKNAPKKDSDYFRVPKVIEQH